jgi:hypothetical protein
MTLGTVSSLLLVCVIKLAISGSFLLNKAASRFPAVVTAGDEHFEMDTLVVKASWSD